MKKKTIIMTLILLAASATLVIAGPYGKGKHRGRQAMDDGGWQCPGMNDTGFSDLELTDKQIEKVRALRESFQKELIPLRTKKFEKKAELRLLWMQTKPDPDKIKANQKEINGLKLKIEEKTTSFRLAFRNLLTKEQLTRFLTRQGGWGSQGGKGSHRGPGKWKGCRR